MNIQIDTLKLKKKGLNINEYLTLLKIYNNINEEDIDYSPHKLNYLSLKDKKYISIEGSNIRLLKKAIKLFETTVRDYITLAEEIRKLFPSGKKDNRYPWRGSLRTLSDRLSKLDKYFGLDKYTDEAIIEATKDYISNFELDKTGMRICPYFLLKDQNSDLVSWLENEKEDVENKDNFNIKL